MTGRSRDTLFDAVITTGVCAATVSPLAGRSWQVLLVAVLASAPVFWRRRAPLAAMLVVGLATTAPALLEAVPRLPYWALVCAYTLAALIPPVLLGLARRGHRRRSGRLLRHPARGAGRLRFREREACGGTLRTGPGPAGAGFAVFATFPIG